ncbi:MAG: transcriptional regulator [Methanosarcinaceae archaeon]|nr:transcriptional regulator [Methanosarcinaceae archaeon]
MSKDVLIEHIISTLTAAGFSLSERSNIRPQSFDIAARRDDTLILFKVLYNIDGLTQDTARELAVISAYLKGSPIIVGAKTRDQMLEDDVVYMRYNIAAINIQTLYDHFIEDIPLLISASPGGFYVSISGDRLKEERLLNNMSLGTLAGLVGVSRRTISKYEEEGMDASIDVVLTLEEVFNVELAKPIDILSPYTIDFLISLEYDKKLPEKDQSVENKINSNSNKDSLNEDNTMLNHISMLGYDVRETTQTPFKAISKDSYDIILTGIGKYNQTTIKRAELMSSISDVAETESIILITGTSKVKNIKDTVFIEKEDLKKIEGSEELIDIIHERKDVVKK